MDNSYSELHADPVTAYLDETATLYSSTQVPEPHQ